jgi:hypothetical protein
MCGDGTWVIIQSYGSAQETNVRGGILFGTVQNKETVHLELGPLCVINTHRVTSALCPLFASKRAEMKRLNLLVGLFQTSWIAIGIRGRVSAL